MLHTERRLFFRTSVSRKKRKEEMMASRARSRGFTAIAVSVLMSIVALLLNCQSANAFIVHSSRRRIQPCSLNPNRAGRCLDEATQNGLDGSAQKRWESAASTGIARDDPSIRAGRELSPHQIIFPDAQELHESPWKSSSMRECLDTLMLALDRIQMPMQMPIQKEDTDQSWIAGHHHIVDPETRMLRISHPVSHHIDPLCWLDAQVRENPVHGDAVQELPIMYFQTAEKSFEAAVIGAAHQIRAPASSDDFWNDINELPPNAYMYGGQRFDIDHSCVASEEWGDFGDALWILPAVELRRVSPDKTRSSNAMHDVLVGDEAASSEQIRLLPEQQQQQQQQQYVLSVHLVRRPGDDSFSRSAKRAKELLHRLSSHVTRAVTTTTLPPIMQRLTDHPREYGFDVDGQEWYDDIVARAIETMERPQTNLTTIEKVVLARRLDLEFETAKASFSENWNGLDLLKTWKFSSAPPGGHYFYIKPSKSQNEFLGCTPERLFSVTISGRVTSEALAGTRPRGSTAEADKSLARELFESSKDAHENQIVADFVRSAFLRLRDGGYLRQSPTDVNHPDAKAGHQQDDDDNPTAEIREKFLVRRLLHLQHICQQFESDLASNVVASDAMRLLLQELHPTPALCGFPQHEALDYIRNNEATGLDRGFYSGPVGFIGKDSAEVVVAIRSALLRRAPSQQSLPGILSRSPARAHLYAGAGIVPGSTVQGEWTETSYKLGVVSSIFPQSPLALHSMPTPNSAWATAFVEELIRNGITMFYICPGSRSTPLVAAISRAMRYRVGQIRAVSIHDERGAAFRAVGFTRGSGHPAVVVTSSGTAVANLYPGVVEASMDGLPIILVTADRPYESRDTGANQAIDQVNMFSPSYVRWFRDVIPPTDDMSVATALSDAAHAVRVSRTARGPVHINIQFRENLAPDAGDIRNDNRIKPSTGFNGLRFTDAPGFQRWLHSGKRWYHSPATSGQDQSRQTAIDMSQLIQQSSRGIIVVGTLRVECNEGHGVSHEEIHRTISEFAEATGFPIIAGVQSGMLRFISPSVIPYAEHLLRTPTIKDNLNPDLVLQIGSPLISTEVSSMIEMTLRRGHHINHVLVLPHHESERRDPDYTVTHRFSAEILPLLGDTQRFLREHKLQAHSELSSLVRLGHHLRKEMGPIIDNAAREVFAEFHLPEHVITEPQIATMLSSMLSTNVIPQTSLFLSNSMPVRDAESFLYPDELMENCPIGQVAINRGASGIDGIIASATGFSDGADEPVMLMIGDVAALHDINSFHGLKTSRMSRDTNTQQRHPLTTIVINNDGGGIFSFLPVAKHGSDVGFDEYFGTPTRTFSFAKSAEAFGINYEVAEDLDALRSSFQRQPNRTDDTVVEIVVAPRDVNTAVHRAIQAKVIDSIASFLDRPDGINEKYEARARWYLHEMEDASHNVGTADAADAKTMVLLHGWMGDAEEWDATAQLLAERLAGQWSIVSIDLPGHGTSSTFMPTDHELVKQALGLGSSSRSRSEKASLDAIAGKVLKSLRDHHGIQRIHAVAGYSLGGRVALAMQRIEASQTSPLSQKLLSADCKLMLLGSYPGAFDSLSEVSSSTLRKQQDQASQRVAADVELANAIVRRTERFYMSDRKPSAAASLWTDLVESWYSAKLWGNLFSSGLAYRDLVTKRIASLTTRGLSIAAVLEGCTPPKNALYDWTFCHPDRTLFMSGQLDRKYSSLGSNWATQNNGPYHTVVPGCGHALLVQAPVDVADNIFTFVSNEYGDTKNCSQTFGLLQQDESIAPKAAGVPSSLRSSVTSRPSRQDQDLIAAIDGVEFEAFALPMYDTDRKEGAVFGVGWGKGAAPETPSGLSSRSGFIVQLFSSSEHKKVGIGEASALPGLHRESMDDVRDQLDEISEKISKMGANHAPNFSATRILSMDGAVDIYLSELCDALGIERLLPVVKAGFEMALLSLASQLTGKPLHEALLVHSPFSTSGRDAVPMLALNGIITRGVQESGRAIDSAKSQRYASMKVKIGHQDTERDFESVILALQLSRRSSSRTGMVRLDANRAWSMDGATQFIDILGKIEPATLQRIEYIEEPIVRNSVWDLEAHVSSLEAFHRATNVSYALDESLVDLANQRGGDFSLMFSDLQKVFSTSNRGCAAFVLKPSVLGMELSAMLARAGRQQLGIGAVFTSTFESGIGLAYVSLLASVSDMSPTAGASENGKAMPDVATDYPHGLGTFSLLADDILSPAFGSYVNENGYLNVVSISRALYGLRLDELRDSKDFLVPSSKVRSHMEATTSRAPTNELDLVDVTSMTSSAGSGRGSGESPSSEFMLQQYEVSTSTSDGGRSMSVSVSLPLPFSAETACSRFIDLPQLPRWSPWISSVKYIEDGRETEWTLNVRGFTFRWRARSSLLEAPLKGIRWESVSGLKNTGIVEFLPGEQSSCLMRVQMEIVTPRILSYLFPENGSFFEEFIKNKLMKWSLEMFRDVVKGDLALEKGDVELGDALFGAVEGKATAIEAALALSTDQKAEE